MNSRVLHVARGVRRGADLALPPAGRCVVGASTAICDVALADDGVAPCHFALSIDGSGRVVCTALDAPLSIGRRELAPGASMVLPDFLPLRCGRCTLLLGPPESDWSFALRAAASASGLAERADGAIDDVRRAGPWALASLVLGSALLVTGSVWATVRWLGAPEPLSDALASTQRWLLATAPRDGEIEVILDESRKRLVVAGYVRTEAERAALAAAVARRPGPVESEVVSAEALVASVARTARQQGLACEAQYRGAGRVACANPLREATAAQQLREVASARVEGLSELMLSVVEVPPAAPAARPAATRRYAVLMSNRRGNALVGPDGRRWAEGDLFDGMRILRIGLDEVAFERDQREHVVALGALGAAGAVNR